MQVRATYVTEFTVRKGKIISSRVIGQEFATADQQDAIAAIRPLLRAFVKSRLRDEIQFENCTINVRVRHSESPRNMEVIFRV